MAVGKTNSKPTTYYTNEGVSIDTFAGTWASTTEFEKWWSADDGYGSSAPIKNGIVIRVEDEDGAISIYKRSKNAWVEIGSTQSVTASSVEYDSSNTYPAGTIGNAVQSIENKTGAEKFPEDTTTAYDAHGLPKGTDISGKTAYQVLDMILNAEFAPVWENSTATLSIATTLYEVGDVIPAESSFVVGGSPASAVGKTTATGGTSTEDELLVDYNELGLDGSSATFGDEIAERGEIEVELTRHYSEGSTQVVTSKGRPTQKTSPIANVKYDIPNTNNSINDSYHIKAEDYTTDTTEDAHIYFCYPIWIDGTQQTLSYSKSEYTIVRNLAVLTNNSFTFEIPESYTNVSVSYLDTQTNKWVACELGSPTAVTKKTGTKKHSVSYNKYTYTNKDLGGATYKIAFTIA